MGAAGEQVHGQLQIRAANPSISFSARWRRTKASVWGAYLRAGGDGTAGDHGEQGYAVDSRGPRHPTVMDEPSRHADSAIATALSTSQSRPKGEMGAKLAELAQKIVDASPGGVESKARVKRGNGRRATRSYGFCATRWPRFGGYKTKTCAPSERRMQVVRFGDYAILYRASAQDPKESK